MSSADIETPDKEVEDSDVKGSAESSVAEGVETPDFAETVLAALEGSEPEAAPASESGDDKSDPETDEAKAAEKKAEAGDEEDVEFPEEELKSFSNHAQNRIRQLVDQKNTAKAQAEDTTRELDTLKPKAEQLDQIVEYMRDNEIESSEFDNALKIVSLIKSDPRRAFEVLTPVYRALAQQTGRILPEDLQERVRLGHISEDDARQLQESRSSAELADRRVQRQDVRAKEAQQQEAHAAQLQQVVQAADNWSKEKAKSDPDWHVKQSLVAEQVELDINRRVQKDGIDGFPKTEAEVVELSKSALKVVESRLKSFGPRLQEKKVVSQDSATPQTHAKPESVEQAMEQALSG